MEKKIRKTRPIYVFRGGVEQAAQQEITHLSVATSPRSTTTQFFRKSTSIQKKRLNKRTGKERQYPRERYSELHTIT